MNNQQNNILLSTLRNVRDVMDYLGVGRSSEDSQYYDLYKVIDDMCTHLDNKTY